MVNPLPTLTASNGGPFCFGSTVDLHATTTATIFNWQGPDSFLSTLQNPTITNATLSAAGSYTVIVRDANQCQNTATTSVVVNPLPVVIVGSNSPVCENATVLLTSSNQSSAAGNTFTWVGPGTPAFTSTAQNPFIPSATPLINGSYTVAITDINGCQNSNVVPVTVTPKPNAPLVSPREFCLNATASALSATADPGAILNWYGTNPSGSSSATASVPVTSPAGSSTYYVSQTISGCESDKASIPVVVNALPTGTLSPVSAACAPLCSPFTFNPASSFNINSYSWNMGNGTQTSTVNSISHCYPESGDFSVAVTLTDDKGCVNTLSFNNFVHVIDIPVADFVYTPAPISIIEPSAEFYNASIGSGIISTTWTIFQHDTDMIYMTGETQPGFTFPESGSFTVQLTVVSSYGCSNTISKPVVVKEEFAVYIPNAFSPDNDNINEEFRVEGVGIAKIDMTIFNRWGESIFTSGEQEKGWNGKNDSNNKVDKGVYIYSITATSFTGEIKQYTGHVTVVR
ncbi:MAG: domain containing protein [Bacteroidetes bacterium]|jgi:gliding motility-associated-like protein|nr:domain containing protein [Bacteroidota bacterium]